MSTARVVNSIRSLAACSRSEGMSSMCDRPCCSPAILPASTSTPTTCSPASANSTASGSPT
jgi:hypothetical protein